MENKEEHLTPDRIFTATQTLQALDALAEEVYITKHSKEVEALMRPSESSIAEMVDDLNQQLPGHILLAAGHGYRMTMTIFANVLMTCGRQDLAEIVAEAQLPEE